MEKKLSKPKFRETFDDKKQLFTEDGRPFENVPLQERAIHHDDSILSGLAASVLVQAVQDWQKLNKGEKKTCVRAEGGDVWRHEVLRFFNGTFCGCILELFVPELTQEEALANMNSLDFNRRQLGCNMTKLPSNRTSRRQA